VVWQRLMSCVVNPTQTPLILQLVKSILTVGSVTVELPNGFQGVLHVRNHDRVLPQPLTAEHTGSSQVQLQLFAINTPLACDATPDALAHDDHPALFTPALQLQPILSHLAALVVGAAPALSWRTAGPPGAAHWPSGVSAVGRVGCDAPIPARSPHCRSPSRP
jgi:hypothetical protein